MNESAKKRLKNLKPTLAEPDDPIYSAGFVVGGRRISSSSQPAGSKPERKESDKEE